MPHTDWKIDDFKKVLVVEGYSDLHFYAEILEELGKNKEVFIKTLTDKSGIFTKLETLISPGFLKSKTTIGFIFDADSNPAKTRADIENALKSLTGQNVVDTNWTHGEPNIGLLIIPGGDQLGEIETLVWNSWRNDPKNADQKQCIEDYINCMKQAGKTAHSPDKGFIGALLAVLSDEDPRLGPAARDNVFDLARPELLLLRNFLSGF